MTSGDFHKVQIDLITVDREGRQRRELTDIDELADSIQRLGLIHPIVVRRDHSLVAGERRLAACLSLGWTHVHCHYTDELDEHILKALELEENIKRKNLEWQDECRAIKEYHDIRKSDDPTWTLEKTGEAIGVERNAVSKRLAVAQEIEKGNERVITAPRFSTAVGIIDRKNARLDAAGLAEFESIARKKGVEAPPSILNTDFAEWAKTYTGPKFNFIHCDFPYGIGADKFNQGAAPLHGGYDDTEDTYWRLCRALLDNLSRIASESCHIMFWFSMHFYQPTLDFFADNSDFNLDPFPLVWLKSDNIGILPDPQRGPRRIYETALFGSRGDRKVVRAKSNAYASPSVRDVHMSVKPEPMLAHFFEMFVDESTSFLDPTCGSGSSVRAAERLAAAQVTGLEINKEFADQANLALKRARGMRKEA